MYGMYIVSTSGLLYGEVDWLPTMPSGITPWQKLYQADQLENTGLTPRLSLCTVYTDCYGSMYVVYVVLWHLL